MSIVNSSTIGVNLGASDGATALFGLGQTVTGSDGSQWIYVNATSALTTGMVLAVTTAYSAQPATASNLLGSALLAAGSPNNGETLAFAQGLFSAADYGWVCLRGANQYVAVSNVSTLGCALYLSVNSGMLTTTAASGTVAGIILLTCTGSTVLAPQKAYLQYPRLQAGALLGV